MCTKEPEKQARDIAPEEAQVGFTKEQAVEALKNALDIRKFEIELYWKRASYFWTFIGLIYVAYCGVLVKMDVLKIGFGFSDDQASILYLISCIGLCLSLAWFYVNKGSKFWQENWENMISMLEEYSIGPSYKLILERPDVKGSKAIPRILFEPESYSVSKINQLVSLFNVVIWLCINTWSIYIMYGKSHFPLLFYICFITSCLFVFLLIFKCSSNLKCHEVKITKRDHDTYNDHTLIKEDKVFQHYDPKVDGAILPNFYLSLIGMIQSIMFGFFLLTVIQRDALNLEGFDFWIYLIKAISVFLMIIITWHEYAYSRKIFYWVPTIFDSFFPFLFGIAQYLVIMTFNNTSLWFISLVLYAVVGLNAYFRTNYMLKKNDEVRDEVSSAIKHLKRMILASLSTSIFFCFSSMLVLVSNSNWLELSLVLLTLVAFVISIFECSDNTRF